MINRVQWIRSLCGTARWFGWAGPGVGPLRTVCGLVACGMALWCGHRVATADVPVATQAATETNRDVTKRSVEISPPRSEPGGQRIPPRGSNSSSRKIARPASSLVQTASGLSVVLGVFLIVVILGRSWSRCRVMAHGDVVRVLARTSITSKHHLHLVKVHNRLLLLAETPSGLQRLDSIDDPAEISRILEADSTHPVETDEEDLPSRSRTSHMARSTILGWFIAILSLGMLGANAPASETAGSVPDIAASGTLTNPPARSDATPAPWDFHPQSWVQPERIQSSLQIVLMMSVLSLAPAIVLMTTSFVRISIVLALLRQALGTPQVPPPQVTTSVSLFLTLLIMGPVWNQVYSKAIQPYTAPHSTMTAHQAWSAGVQPVREFMANQIELQRNTEDVWLFMRQFASDSEPPTTYEDVPLQALLPAFVLSELKTAFLIGFQVYLPLLVIDVVVATVINAMGLVTLPASMVSLPLKLLLFVLVDGWHLIVGLLLASFHGGTL